MVKAAFSSQVEDLQSEVQRLERVIGTMVTWLGIPEAVVLEMESEHTRLQTRELLEGGRAELPEAGARVLRAQSSHEKASDPSDLPGADNMKNWAPHAAHVISSRDWVDTLASLSTVDEASDEEGEQIFEGAPWDRSALDGESIRPPSLNFGSEDSQESLTSANDDSGEEEDRVFEGAPWDRSISSKRVLGKLPPIKFEQP